MTFPDTRGDEGRMTPTERDIEALFAALYPTAECPGFGPVYLSFSKRWYGRAEAQDARGDIVVHGDEAESADAALLALRSQLLRECEERARELAEVVGRVRSGT